MPLRASPTAFAASLRSWLVVKWLHLIASSQYDMTIPHRLVACEQPFRMSTITGNHLVARTKHTHAIPCSDRRLCKATQASPMQHDVHESLLPACNMTFCAAAIPGPSNDATAYRSTADLFASHLLYFPSALSWCGRVSSYTLIFGILRS